MALLGRKLIMYRSGSHVIRRESNQPSASSNLTIYHEKSLNFLKNNQKKSIEYLRTKVTHAYSWYEEFSGIRELKEAQNRVLFATTLLKDAQERRREAKSPLSSVQKRLQDFQPELRNTPRDDDRYIQLIKEEHLLMKEIKFLQLQLQEAESDEREAFEQLSTSLRTSHEAERVQAEKTKYFSIIASILGTIIGVLGSSINNNYRMKELKALVKDSSASSEIQTVLAELQMTVTQLAAVDSLTRINDRLDQAVAENNAVAVQLERIGKQFENIISERDAIRLETDSRAFTPEGAQLVVEKAPAGSFVEPLKGWFGIGEVNQEGQPDLTKKLLLPIGAFMVMFVCINELLH